MATTISRSLEQIEIELKKIDSAARTASREAASLGRSLKLDPNNMQLAAARTAELQKQADLAAQKVALLKKRQDELKKSNIGTETTDEYKKLENQILKTEAQAKALNNEIAKTKQQKLDSINDELGKMSKVALAVITAVTGIVAAFVKIGDEINKATNRFKISAEEFQKGKFIFSKASGNDNAYTQALDQAQALLSQVAKGSAKAATSLGLVGLTLDDLKGKTAAEAIDILIEALRGVADPADRSAIATAILGSAGADLALVTELTSAEVSKLKEQLEAAGLVTGEQAQKAADLNDKLDLLKQQFMVLAVNLGESLIPAFEALLSLVKVFIPVIQLIADVFNLLPKPLQSVLMLLLVFIAVLPMLAKAFLTVNKAMAVMGANPIAMKIMLIAGAIALVITLLVQLAKWLSSVFGKTWTLDVDTSLATQTLSGTNEALGVGSTGGEGTTNITYNDYSTQNNTINNQDDIDEVIAKLNEKKIQAGGK